ncbi:hypothetical protein PROSTU_02882 [Providencia stuartii ATCC 25827]|uniref:Uncharacterized protein n=1 Tax=Providencia stuartii ATCC 25827 TaxID=471874 RepID=A0AA86YKG4_PROST|nr:hypothetical protein PROSTU_02882 [Providencia stuartii ATCC 25827]
MHFIYTATFREQQKGQRFLFALNINQCGNNQVLFIYIALGR